MASSDLFESYTASLTELDRKAIHPFLQERREELFAARSEEARLRIVNDFIKTVHELLKKAGRRP